MNDITDTLIKEMPTVQQNAIDQLEVDQEKQKESIFLNLKDRMGRAFDKALHGTDDEGKPLLTKGGQLRIVRGRKERMKKPESVSSIGGLDSPVTFADGQPPGEAEILATGQSAASLTFVIGMAVFGSDGQPSKDEINQVTYAYQTYFRAKNIRDLPPGVVLVTALMTYTVPRMLKPKQAKKISSLWDKLRVKFSKQRRGAPEKDVESIPAKDA